MKKKYYTTKAENVTDADIKNHPWDLLDNVPLLTQDCEFSDIYEVDVKSKEVISKLTLRDFINDGIEVVKRETSDNNSSGNWAQIGSSGNWARIGSSGNDAQIGSSGNDAQIGSSGNWARIEASGEHSIAFACGNKSYIKAKKGTWISLAEYDNDGNPCFALAAQIGNEEYKDFQENVLSDKHFYMLCHKQFVKVKPVDGYIMVLLSEKKTGELTIYKTQYLEDYMNGKNTTQYVAEQNNITAHGETVKKAVADLEFKVMQTKDVSEHVKRVKESGYITPTDYRLLTGACESGTNRWLNENGFTWDDKKPIAEVIELTRGAYGHERLVELLGEEL